MSGFDHASSTCPHCDEVGAYALHALDDADARAYEEHLRTCDPCRLELAQLQLVVDSLPIVAPQVPAPDALKRRIMAVVESESQLLRAAGASADVPAPAPARRRWRLPSFSSPLRTAVAAGMACLLVAAGVEGGMLASDDGPETRTISAWAQGTAGAKLAMTGDDATLEVVDMPTLSEGRVYQVWFDRGDGKPQPTHTLFNVRAEDGRARVAIDESIEGVEKILVTAEPSGGAQTPSGPPVITATPT